MALTKEQWFQKLKGWVPNWFFETANYQEAHFYALAELLRQAQEEMEAQRDTTFIMQSSAPELDLHGAERTTARVTGENDSAYQLRVQALTNKVNKPDLKSIIDSLLLVGECTILEGFKDGPFLDREAFCNREDRIIENIFNSFAVYFDNQRPEPFSYFDRENFMDREDFSGSLETPQAFFDAIIQAINANKALGILYTVTERPEV